MEETALTDASHHLYSSFREKIVEHVFVGDALRALWRRGGVFNVEVLRSEFDAHGSAFLSVETLDEVLELLFGDLPSGSPPVLVDEGFVSSEFNPRRRPGQQSEDHQKD